jgi:hypothetical protein
MTWYTQTLELADDNGKGTGKFRHTAKSDESSSGIIGLCKHAHDSAKEAYECPDAIAEEGRVTGIPRRVVRPADAAISNAMYAVEAMAAHPLLTDAIVHLERARLKVSSYFDEVDGA